MPNYISYKNSISIDGDAKVSGAYIDSNNSSGAVGQVLTSTGSVSEWATAPADVNNYVDSLAFSTATGVLTLGRSGLASLTVDLDGRYALSSSLGNYLPLTGGTLTGVLSGTSGTFSGTVTSTVGINNWAFKDASNSGLWRSGNGGSDLYLRNTSGGVTTLLSNTGSSYINGGNVGIGTTSPNRKLSVAGGIELTVADMVLNTTNAGIRRGNAGEMFLDAPGHVIVTIDSNNNNVDRFFGINKDASTELFRVQENGNVGIGTTSPVSKLHIAGNSSIITVQDSNSTGNTATANVQLSDNGTFGTIGTIGFKGDNDLYIQNNHTGNILLDSTGNVGVGTTTPSSKLEIAQSEDNRGIKIIGYDNESNSSLNLYVDNFGNDYITSSEFLGIHSGGSARLRGQGYLRLEAGGSSSNSINVDVSSISLRSSGTTQMYVNGVTDSIGIGTTTPTEKLHVDGGNVKISSGGNTFLNMDHGNVGFITFTDTSIASPNQFSIQHNYSQSNDFRISRNTGGSDFVIDNSGNVGIGTTTPTSNLTVKGNGGTVLDIQGSQGQLFSITDSLVGDLFSVSDISGIPILNVNSSGAVNLDGTLDSTGNITGLNLSGTNTGDNAVNSLYSGLTQSKFVDGTDPLDAVYTGGNVGIGTTSPSSKLHIQSDDVLDDSLLKLGSSIANVDFKFEVGNTLLGLHSKNLVISGSSAASDIAFSPSSIYPGLLVLDGSTGNVGIGTTSPRGKLTIGMGGHIIGDESFRIGTGGTGNTPETAIKFTGNAQDFYVSNGIKMTVQAGGNVGIGTTSPQTKLQVSGDISVTYTKGFRMYNSAGTGWGQMTLNNGDNLLEFNRGIQNSGVDFRLSENSAHSYVCANEANFGIGTVNPGHKLVVSGGNAQISHTEPTLFFNDTTTGHDDWKISADWDQFNIQQYVNDTTYTTRIMSDSTGQVGIGTSSPRAKLDVAGGIKMADDSSTASSANAGTQRYREDANNSYVDMCMRTGATTYEWVNIVQNNY